MSKESGVSFIHIADVHLGMEPESEHPFSKIRAQEIKDTFNKIIGECNRCEADLLLIAGDLFHKRPSTLELNELRYSFSKLEKTRVVMIAGNHDFVNPGSAYDRADLGENVFFLKSSELDSVYFEDLDTEVFGYSFRTERRTDRIETIVSAPSEDKAAGDSAIRLLLAHGGTTNSVPLSRSDSCFAPFDYVALGHIHIPDRSGKVRYAGTLEPLDRNEVGERGYIYGKIVSPDGRKLLTAEFVPFASRNYVNCEIDVDPDTTMGSLSDAVRRCIEQNGEQNLYNITLRGNRAPEFAPDIENLCGLGYICSVVDETYADFDFEELLRNNRDNALGMYIEKIRKAGVSDELADRALYVGVEALLKQ